MAKGREKSVSRKMKQVFLVFCEGETEENYIDFLKNNEEFETKFYDVGDGLSVSIRKTDV